MAQKISLKKLIGDNGFCFSVKLLIGFFKKTIKIALTIIYRALLMTTLEKIKIILFGLIIMGILLYSYLSDISIVEIFKDLKIYSAHKPVEAALLFVGFFVLIKFAFIPMAPISLIAGYMFGPFWGSLLAIFTVVFSSTVMFLFARFLAADFIKKILENKFRLFKKYNQKLENNGFATVLFFRIVPVLPLGVINMGLGATRVKFMDFLLASIAGVIPGTVILAYAGNYFFDWNNPKLYLFLSLYLAFLLVTFYLKFRQRRKYGKKEKN